MPPHFVTGPGSLMGNAIFFKSQKGGANVLQMMMARSQIWTILDKTMTNAWWDNSVVSELKENFRLSQPTPRLFFGGILFLVVEATNSLLTILS